MGASTPQRSLVGLNAAQARDYQVLIERLLPHLTARCRVEGRMWIVVTHDSKDPVSSYRVLRHATAVLDFLVEQVRILPQLTQRGTQ